MGFTALIFALLAAALVLCCITILAGEASSGELLVVQSYF